MEVNNRYKTINIEDEDKSMQSRVSARLRATDLKQSQTSRMSRQMVSPRQLVQSQNEEIS